jgi:hypothetical protein
VLIGFAIGPGVPYQDATPAMRALEKRQSEHFVILGLAGLLLFIMGVLGVITRWVQHRFVRGRSHEQNAS